MALPQGALISNVSASTTASVKVAVAAATGVKYRVLGAVISSSALQDTSIASSTGIVFGPVTTAAGMPAVLPICGGWCELEAARALGIQCGNAVTSNVTFVYTAISST